MKKLFYVLSVVLALCLFSGMTKVTSNAADGAAVITVTPQKSEVEVGKNISFTVSLENSPGIVAIELRPVFDHEVFESISIEEVSGTPFSGGWHLARNALWMNTSLENVEFSGGDILILNFKLKENAVIGKTQVSFNASDALASMGEGGEQIHVPYTVIAGQIEVLDHDWDEGEITREPTCAKEGEIKYICRRCGDVKTEPIPKLPHKIEVRNAKDPTCTEPGYTGDKVCTVCGQTIEKGKSIPALGHDWDEGEVTKEPTCTKQGEKSCTCKVCHSPGKLKIPALGHDWDDGKVTKEPTCTEEGRITYTCKRCGDTKAEPVPALGHKIEIKNAKEPTAQEKGYTGDKVCAVCGQVIEKGSDIPVKGHKWDEGTVTKEPTCTQPGEKTYTCKECGVTETVEIPALGHEWDEGAITKEPTDKETGIKIYTCKICGETKTEVLPELETEKTVPSNAGFRREDSILHLGIMALALCLCALVSKFIKNRKQQI